MTFYEKQVLEYYNRLKRRGHELTTTTVAGETYEVWSDMFMRGTFARNAAGEIKQISYSGYISNDLTVRKAIMHAYKLATFRK